MVRGSLMQVVAQLPCPSRAKEGEEPKKYPSQLEPKNARELDEGRPDRLPETLAAAHQPLPGLPCLGRRLHSLLRHPCACSLRRLLHPPRPLSRSTLRCTRPCTLWSRSCSLRRRVRRCRCIDGRHQRLRSRTRPNPKRSSKANRIHTGKCSRFAPRCNRLAANLQTAIPSRLPTRIAVASRAAVISRTSSRAASSTSGGAVFGVPL
jgi:hypothetical protein